MDFFRLLQEVTGKLADFKRFHKGFRKDSGELERLRKFHGVQERYTGLQKFSMMFQIIHAGSRGSQKTSGNFQGRFGVLRNKSSEVFRRLQELKGCHRHNFRNLSRKFIRFHGVQSRPQWLFKGNSRYLRNSWPV